MGENISNISSESTHQSHPPKKSCMLLESVSTEVIQRITKFQILDFCHFFSFSLTWDNMGVKVSNDISESMHQICSPKFLHTHGEGLKTKVVNRIVKFDILNFLAFFFSFWDRLTW